MNQAEVFSNKSYQIIKRFERAYLEFLIGPKHIVLKHSSPFESSIFVSQ